MRTSSSIGTRRPCSVPRAMRETIRMPTRRIGSVPPARPSPERWTKRRALLRASSRSIRRSASRGSKTTSAPTSTSSWKSTSRACDLRDCPNDRAAPPCRHRLSRHRGLLAADGPRRGRHAGSAKSCSTGGRRSRDRQTRRPHREDHGRRLAVGVPERSQCGAMRRRSADGDGRPHRRDS